MKDFSEDQLVLEVITRAAELLQAIIRSEVRAELARRDPQFAEGTKGNPLVYFIQAGDDGPIKIGVAEKPMKRLAELQVASPVELNLLAVMKGGVDRERRLHTKFAEWRLHGEWFEGCDVLINLIDELKSNAVSAPLSESADTAPTTGG